MDKIASKSKNLTEKEKITLNYAADFIDFRISMLKDGIDSEKSFEKLVEAEKEARKKLSAKEIKLINTAITYEDLKRKKIKRVENLKREKKKFEVG